MKIYLVQHGDSLSKESDLKRPLSQMGEQDIERLGKFIAHLDLQVSAIYHSGKLRAEQTANRLKLSISRDTTIEAIQGLDPLDHLARIEGVLNKHDQNIMLVGHLPFLSKLVSQLIVNDENQCVVSFQPGTIVCLEKNQQSWALNWMVQPSLFK